MSVIGPNKVVKTKRRVTESGDKIEYPDGAVYHLENIQAYIEPASAELASMLEIDDAYSVFRMLCDLVDIVRNDLVIDADGLEYKVNGIKSITDPIDSHLELVLTIPNT